MTYNFGTRQEENTSFKKQERVLSVFRNSYFGSPIRNGHPYISRNTLFFRGKEGGDNTAAAWNCTTVSLGNSRRNIPVGIFEAHGFLMPEHFHSNAVTSMIIGVGHFQSK